MHTDHLGTPRLLTDNQGQTVWQAIYRPFGEAGITRNTIDFPHRLPGQYVDAETGTHYNHFRDYDPATGRYLSSDPIGLHGGANTYAYAGGNPLAATDVLGLADSLVIGAGSPGLFDIAQDAAATGLISDADAQLAIEGMGLVPKPAVNSEFVQKLEAVFARAAEQLRDHPAYTDSSSSGKARYRQSVFLDGAPAVYLVDDDLYAVHPDHLGTPRLLTDNAGQTVWQAIYRPFGEAEITRNTVRGHFKPYCPVCFRDVRERRFRWIAD